MIEPASSLVFSSSCPRRNFPALGGIRLSHLDARTMAHTGDHDPQTINRSGVSMDLLESQNAKDARVERLWRQLDTLKKGELDMNDLRRGLKKIDHRKQPEAGCWADD